MASTVNPADIHGQIAYVTTEIPAGTTGRIVLARPTGPVLVPATAADGAALPARQRVRVVGHAEDRALIEADDLPVVRNVPDDIDW